ncbi:hypothetical protein EWM64_g10981, partial [Hericium alpestre]
MRAPFPLAPRVHFPGSNSGSGHGLTAREKREKANMAEGSEALAMQFYRIELGEQRRLMGVMEHHSRESGRLVSPGKDKRLKDNDPDGVEADGEADGEVTKKKDKKKRKASKKDKSKGKKDDHGAKGDFPYSITAGVEKGAKNRQVSSLTFYLCGEYRNIWPFEHTRVRLQKQKPPPRAPPPTTATEVPPAPAPATIQVRKNPSPPNKRQRGPPGPLHSIPIPSPALFLPPPTTAFNNVASLAAKAPLPIPLTTPVEQDSDDYVNASYVQPLGTKKRYIATQGPMPETFVDFWT